MPLTLSLIQSMLNILDCLTPLSTKITLLKGWILGLNLLLIDILMLFILIFLSSIFSFSLLFRFTLSVNLIWSLIKEILGQFFLFLFCFFLKLFQNTSPASEIKTLFPVAVPFITGPEVTVSFYFPWHLFLVLKYFQATTKLINTHQAIMAGNDWASLS